MSSILPGIFYWKISCPRADLRHLIKDGDDEYDAEMGLPAFTWAQDVLRKAALGLACYGVLVMITCLSLNIFGKRT